MAFVIESSPTLPLIQIRMIDPVDKGDGIRMLLSLRLLFERRSADKLVYIGIDLSKLALGDEVPLLQIVANLAAVYHEQRKNHFIEMLMAVDATLLPIVRYVAEQESLPMLYFASFDTLHTHVLKRNSDTKPIHPELARAAVTGILRNLDD